jgi:hypothetical protein
VIATEVVRWTDAAAYSMLYRRSNGLHRSGMVICPVCSMKDELENRPYQGEKEATLDAHTALAHPDRLATRREQVELERRLRESVEP